MATPGEDARVLIQVDVLVCLTQDKVHNLVFDFFACTRLAVLVRRTSLATQRRTLMTTLQLLVAPFGARNVVARGRTRHCARAVWTSGEASLFGTWGAWFLTFLGTFGVATLHVTWFSTRGTRLIAMANRTAEVGAS